jgi:voltage-gated potassium channel
MKIPVASVYLRRRRAQRLRRDAKDPWRRFRTGVTALAAVIVVGTVGYSLLGLDLFDALYQTAITITTVGYGEIGPPEQVDRAYRAFTLVLVLVGASSAIYTVSILLETVVEGSLNDGWRRRRMQRVISSMQGHMIVAGWGRVGRAIAHYAARLGQDVVVVDLHATSTDGGPPIVTGDANDDDVLLAAGIDRASVLVAALSSDTDNLSLTLTARSLGPDLFVVARTSEQRNERKFFQAGANRVVNPHEIGGSRMAAVALEPSVAEFLDEVLHDEFHDVEIRELELSSGSALVGRPIGEYCGGDDQALAIAVRPAGGTFVANPTSSVALDVGDLLIVMGAEHQVDRLRAAADPRRTTVYRGVRQG